MGGCAADGLVEVFGAGFHQDNCILAGWDIIFLSQTSIQLVEASQVVVDAVLVELHLERGISPGDDALVAPR